MPEIKWLPEALGDVERLHAFLASRNKHIATRAAQSILDVANSLKDFPEIGRPMSDETKRRELFIPFGTGAYVIRYLIENQQTAIIVRVWHSREERSNL